MRKRKKHLALTLALVMALALLPTAALAVDNFAIEDDVLTEYTGPGGHVVIPDNITSIGHSAFLDCTSLTSVTIPDSVTSIGTSAFNGCTNLTSVTIPDGITEISDGAFFYCTSLTSVTIPDSVTSIGWSAFDGCINLTSVTIPDSVTSIGDYAFYRCTRLTSITIPDGITEICNEAFRGCTSLTSVTIPDSVTSIGRRAFEDCASLTDVYYGGSEAQWAVITINYRNDNLENATIHYNSAPAPVPAANTAYASTQTMQVDGKAVTFECYALKDASGNATNYIKLRDLAMLLNGSAAQFQVGWDGSVTITTKTAYTPNGTELSTPYSGDRACEKTTAATKVNGQTASLAAFVLNDDAGGGYTYYQLRDVGQALGFNVGWAADKGIFVETDKPYDSAN